MKCIEIEEMTKRKLFNIFLAEILIFIYMCVYLSVQQWKYFHKNELQSLECKVVCEEKKKKDT